MIVFPGPNARTFYISSFTLALSYHLFFLIGVLFFYLSSSQPGLLSFDYHYSS